MNSKTIIALFILFPLILSGRAYAADENVETMDKIICAIDNNTVTLEQMEIEKAILAYSKDSLLFPGREASLTLGQVLDELVARRLLVNAAVKMGFGRAEMTVVDKVLDDFHNAFGSKEAYKAFLERYQLTDPSFKEKTTHVPSELDIDYRFKTLAVVKKYANKKLELQVRLGLESYLTNHKEELEKKNPGAGQEEIKKAASQEIYNEQLLEWIRDLAGRAKISLLDDEYRDEIDKFLRKTAENGANTSSE